MAKGIHVATLEAEARRVAACFFVASWSPTWEWELGDDGQTNALGVIYFGATATGEKVHWGFLYNGVLRMIGFGDGRPALQRRGGSWQLVPRRTRNREKDQWLARGLYCLGIDDESVWRELLEVGVELSAHEKLELGLELPREFWPTRWIEEAEKQ